MVVEGVMEGGGGGGGGWSGQGGVVPAGHRARWAAGEGGFERWTKGKGRDRIGDLAIPL